MRPAHTTHDGDTVFALATGGYIGERPAGFDTVANVAVEMVAEAIRNGSGTPPPFTTCRASALSPVWPARMAEPPRLPRYEVDAGGVRTSYYVAGEIGAQPVVLLTACRPRPTASGS